MGDELLGGRYRLEDVLGWGGMATVWRGYDTRLDRPVAVKTLNLGQLRDPSAAARFDREARTVARLTHPNIVSVYDVGTQDATGYIVMELVDGVTVASMLADGPLPIEQATSIAGQTADALGAAHATGIVHRDVKPANIMVTPAGTVKVCDFGIAREVQATGPTLTAADAAIGTAAYMAPEQAAGGAVDARTDLYALGCVLYAMLTGEPPFTGGAPIEVAYQQLHNTPAPVRSRRPETPTALGELVSGLLAKDPADRPADAATVRAALDHPYALVTARTGSTPGAPARSGGVGRPTGPGTTRPIARAAASAPVPPGSDREPAWFPDAPERRERNFLAPVLVATIAVALLIAAAFVITALLDRRHPPAQSAPPSSTPASITPAKTAATGSTPPPSPSSTPRSTASDPVDVVRGVLQPMVAAGQIDPGAADDLNHQLDDIDHALASGHTKDAQHKVRQMSNHLEDLVHDGKLSPAGSIALAAALDTLAAALAGSGDGGD